MGWLIAGWISVSLAVTGVFLPIVPQVPFAVLAAFCFSRGSPRLHHWILNHKHFGPPVRDWELDQVIRPRMKITSILMMTGGAALAYWKFHEDQPKIAYGMPALFALAAIFVATRRSKSRVQDTSRDEFRPPVA